MSVEAVDATRLRPSKGDDGGSPDSWHSLPLRGEEGGERDHQESGSTQAQPAVLMVGRNRQLSPLKLIM